MVTHDDLKIIKFPGRSHQYQPHPKNPSVPDGRGIQGKDYVLSLPVYGSSGPSAITNGQIWRNKDGNMERIRQAILNGLCQLPALPKS